MMKKFLKNEKGLTLIELLAVIVILGIIAAIAIPSIGGIIQKSREDAVKADAIQVLNAAKVYMASNNVENGSENTMDQEVLAEYVDFEGEGFGTYEVSYKDGKYELTAEGDAGSETIKFENATIKGIKASGKSLEITN